uniref:Uncharacterized protein n=1 Tax=Anguilla anguilla TaxID=7936 RepID=A0A0E9UZ17_ANGAN
MVADGKKHAHSRSGEYDPMRALKISVPSTNAAT